MKLIKILPHITIIISGMFIVFYFIDRVNSAMNFINNDISKALIFILSIVAIITSILLIAVDRKNERNRK